MKHFNALDKAQQEVIIKTVKRVIEFRTSTNQVFKDTLQNLPDNITEESIPGLVVAVNEFVFENVRMQLINY